MLLNPEEIARQLEEYNVKYRDGSPEISDAEYDDLVETLRLIAPKHPFLQRIEPDLIAGQPVKHKSPMLSTEKAYKIEDLKRFVDRVVKASEELGLNTPIFKVTPKLDGMAGFDQDGVLASRGNGLVGSDITHILQRGVQLIGERNQGAGEVVMCRSYFDSELSNDYEHPRNLVVGIVKSDEVGEVQQRALDAGAVHFVSYQTLPKWEGEGTTLLAEIESVSQRLAEMVDYPLDGMVAEAVDEELKTYMGATSHHHRWQIAIKTKGDTAETVIEDIEWQTGRTGVITPVLIIQPVKLSGAELRKVSAHHAGMIRAKQLGVGARVRIIRSGEVIPKLEEVIEPARVTHLPTQCPSCNGPLSWRRDFLCCTQATLCTAQTETTLRHWFKILGTADGFGPKTLEVLVREGHTTVDRIYALKVGDFRQMGFGDKQSQNLDDALKVSLNTPIEDARFLAAFGLAHLGIGESRRLLREYPIDKLASLTEADLLAIHGFGDKTSPEVVAALQAAWPQVQYMLSLGFTLEYTPLSTQSADIESPIAGRSVMFTGKMQQGTREEMQVHARGLGATVLTSVSKKLNLLIAGPGAGSSKLKKAESYGITVLDEVEYRRLIQGS